MPGIFEAKRYIKRQKNVYNQIIDIKPLNKIVQAPTMISNNSGIIQSYSSSGDTTL